MLGGRGRSLRALASVLVTLSIAAGCGPGDAGEPRLVVSAASSLAEVVTLLARRYGEADPGGTVATNFAASGTLVQQIRQGAGVDVFLSASDREMNQLLAEGLVDPRSVVVVASNELVVVVPASAGRLESIAQLAEPAVERLAIGAPASVPAGAYARETLQKMGLWEALEGKIVYASSVRQALTYVESGEVDAAFVYRTDAMSSSSTRLELVMPPETHSPIRYTAGVVAASGKPEAAARFIDFLSGAEGVAVFRELGFGPARPREGD